jgi:hypothetical protein
MPRAWTSRATLTAGWVADWRQHPPCQRTPVCVSICVHMRRDELLQRKRELDERLRAGIELLEAAHRAEVRALETLWVSYGEPESPDGVAALPVPEAPAPPVVPTRRPSVRREAGTLYEEVLAALDQVPQEFDKNDVCRAIGHTPQRASLHRVLQELIFNGTLEVEFSGLGRRPTVYRSSRLPDRRNDAPSRLRRVAERRRDATERSRTVREY